MTNYSEDPEWVRRLSAAIILQAAVDWRNYVEMRREIRHFIFGPWFSMLTDIDPNTAYRTLVARYGPERRKP